MYELELFAGAGGGILGSLLRGHTCIGAVEKEEYPRKVLLQRQRDGILPHFPIWDDVTTFRIDNPECREYIEFLRTIREQLCISGGFPCQDISAAGKGSGITKDSRSGLWFEFARIICEIRPARVFVENSPVLTSRGLGIVLGDLAEMGYNAKWGVLGAVDVGAPHKRERIWISATNSNKKSVRKQSELVEKFKSSSELEHYGKEKSLAYSNKKRCPKGANNSREECEEIRRSESSIRCDSLADTHCSGCSRQILSQSKKRKQETKSIGGGKEIPDSTKVGCEGKRKERNSISKENGGEKISQCNMCNGNFWSTEPALGRVANGVANRVDRLEAIGNGQVPGVENASWEILS